MNVTQPIQPKPDEPCSPGATPNPLNAMLSLGALAQMLPIDSARSLGALLGLTPPFSLRDALLKGTRLAIQQEMIQPPAAFVAGQEGRLIEGLRLAAMFKDPRKVLSEAALHSLQGFDALATAWADLAVTGRASYEKFVLAPPAEGMLVQDVRDRMQGLHMQIPSEADIRSALKIVLDRAYKVAFALRGPYPERAAIRRSLGWIAVSGEDDPPHRPVNMPAPPYPQYEIPVTVGSVTVQTRFFIASPPPAADRMTTTGMPSPGRALPPAVTPLVPDGDRVLLFIHGHSSSAEEALALIPSLHQAGLARGIRFSVISMDLPSNGYSSMIDHSRVASSEKTTFPGGVFDKGPINTPILDFIEDFIVAFVDCLDSNYTPIKNRFAGVIGGSLGGNMGLRLGRRNLQTWAWLANAIVSWSPASVWDPMVQDEIKRHAPEQCRDKWGVEENSLSRADYFYEVYDKNILDVILPHKQPEMWFRNGWEPCKTLHIEASRIARREIYNKYYRRWHWRVAGEQLIYSHVDRVNHEDSSSPYRYELNQVRQLLVAGDQDNFVGSNIFDATRKLAALMVNTPGRSLFLLNTGHSIHDERPGYLAEQIAKFLTVEAG